METTDLTNRHTRAAAALIAMIAWTGLAVQVAAVIEINGSAAATLWRLLLYFTIITNLLVAILFSGLAFGRATFSAPRRLAFVTLSILLVGIVHGLLLRGLVHLSGAAWLADVLLHDATPVLVPLYWLGFAPKGLLPSWDPLIWSGYPVVYLIYALIRGATEGRYPYPFIDGPVIGWGQAGINIVLIGIGFLAAGHGLTWLDHKLSDRRGG